MYPSLPRIPSRAHAADCPTDVTAGQSFVVGVALIFNRLSATHACVSPLVYSV
jgi:hypothetical protein